MGVSLLDQTSTIRMEMQDSLAAIVLKMKRQDAHQTTGLPDGDHFEIDALATKLSHAGDSGKALVASLNVLQGLQFPGMSQRYTTVHKAHNGTCEWAFTNELSDWLQSGDTLFWVTGKPGSGKSTLMKRLVDNPQTSLLLRKWSGVKTPVVASYFFWIKGTGLQRSDLGLLRCILYDYLRQCPTVAPYVFPTLSANMMAGHQGVKTMDWKRDDLLQAFHRLAVIDTKSAHLCLFIDGLDEYQGDYEDLIEIVQHLSRLKIKICVASRPWNVFEGSFGSLPQLRMQDLNRSDIEIYVRDKLFLRDEFQRARVTAKNMDIIMSEITAKAQGVFLWVYLVVRSLIEGLRNLDSISLLMKRLNSFPSDLNEFFQDIFSSLDPIYRKRTAKMFLLTLETTSSLFTRTFGPTCLTTLTHWYLDELEEQPEESLSVDAAVISEDAVVEYSSTACLRINGRCKGLLEMIPGHYRRRAEQEGQPEAPFWYDVTFLHRSVADFLELPDIWRLLNEWLDGGMDTGTLICQTTLAEIKTILALDMNCSLADFIQPAATRFLQAAAMHEKTHGASLTPLLDDLSRILINRTLCSPLLFMRLLAEYDLLIYIKCSPLWLDLAKDPASKADVLNGTGPCDRIYEVIDRRRESLSPEMICLIRSMDATIAKKEIRKEEKKTDQKVQKVQKVDNKEVWEVQKKAQEAKQREEGLPNPQKCDQTNDEKPHQKEDHKGRPKVDQDKKNAFQRLFVRMKLPSNTTHTL